MATNFNELYVIYSAHKMGYTFCDNDLHSLTPYQLYFLLFMDAKVQEIRYGNHAQKDKNNLLDM